MKLIWFLNRFSVDINLLITNLDCFISNSNNTLDEIACWIFRIFKNDYIKLREISVDYTIPKRLSQMLRLQKVSVNLAVRNLGYIHKTVPDIDAESALGAQGFIENSFYPTTRSFSFGVNVSF